MIQYGLFWIGSPNLSILSPLRKHTRLKIMDGSTLIIFLVFKEILRPSFRIQVTNSLHVFGRIFKKNVGTQLKFRTPFHPQTDSYVNMPFKTLNTC